MVLYHGNKTDRETIRRDKMKVRLVEHPTQHLVTAALLSFFISVCPPSPLRSSHALSLAALSLSLSLSLSRRQLKDQKEMRFPVVITSFEILMIDRPHLERYVHAG